MRNLIFTMFSLLFFVTQSEAATLESMYKECAVWSNLDFADKAPAEKLANVVACRSYMIAWRDAAFVNCSWVQEGMPFKNAAFGMFNNLSVEQLAQLTVNYAKQHPENWDANVASLWFEIALPTATCN